MAMTVEILGPSGRVHYTRPIDHPMVKEALTTPGYAVRLPGCRDLTELEKLKGLEVRATLTMPPEGLTLACPSTEPVPNVCFSREPERSVGESAASDS